MPRVVIDADVGIDDMLAIWYLVRQPDVSLEAVTACHGNISAAQSAANARKVLDILGRPDIPVAIGSEQAIERALGTETQVHGDDGLGGAGVAHPDPQGFDDAVDVLRELSQRYAGDIDLLATGSLTNIGRLAMTDPSALGRFRSIVFLGTVGAICQPDAQHVVDANVAYDAGALPYLQGADNAVICPVDATASVTFEVEDLARIDALDSDIGRLASRALATYVRFHRAHTYRTAIRVHDPAAAVALVRPGVRAVTRPRVLDWVSTTGRERQRGVVVRGSLEDGPLPQAIRSGDRLTQVVAAFDVPAVTAELLAAYERS